MQRYYAIGKERKGPVNDDEIRRLIQDGTLTATSLLWNTTMGSAWTPLANIPRLLSEPDAAQPGLSDPPAATGTQSALKFAKQASRSAPQQTTPAPDQTNAADALRVAKAGSPKLWLVVKFSP